MAKLAFELVSPERLLLSVESEMVTIPGAEGDLGILPGHAPLISALRPGVIEVEGAEAADRLIFVAGGVAEVVADRLTVLAEEAISLGRTDRATVERQIQEAREDLADARSEESRADAQARLDTLQIMLKSLEGAAAS